MATPHSTATLASEGRQASRKLLFLGRLGYAAKGVVYLLVGGLAFLAAVRVGGDVSGSKGAVSKILELPFGRILMGLMALGLLSYVVWRLVQAAIDPGQEGHDKEGVGKRVAHALSGLSHLALAFFAGSLALGNGGGSSSGGTSSWTAKLMAQPFGPWLVALAGLVVGAIGALQFHRAWTASFLERYDHSEMDAKTRRTAKRVGQAGLAARGVVFLVIAVFLMIAAWQHDASESKGMEGALQSLAQQPYGPWLLGIVGAGLVAYGVFCFSYARYRDFQRT